jgi:hypothetical protein
MDNESLMNITANLPQIESEFIDVIKYVGVLKI